ncbi:hypothetical protein K469DRAFT_697852 [Zopfia rhizophila CBS 207.26]|uniref:Uncharacterized protein n=1 Tax=Zopfia rhizophila CBS 207.26 TaxID=1314779 RepID=A0A6A6EGF9_9PEZI|nr:hypothetical protein K469DRAFT_697852 [Zopfia rhizophila CBS 207.26]
MSIELLRTPERPSKHHPIDTHRREKYFHALANRQSGEHMSDIATQCGISTWQGYNLRKELNDLGHPNGIHRVRKLKAEKKSSKLKSLFQILQETPDKMCKDTNLV